MAKPRTIAGRAREVAARLAREYPGTAKELCALHHDTPFQLLVATILSAQSTDERVNLVTPKLFAAFGTPEKLAAAPLEKVEELIYSTGFFRAKARSLVGMAREIVERFDGEVPTEMDELTSLPGVGRKTANVIRSVDFDLPGFPVDTHVGRLVRRLGLSAQTDPDKVEAEVTALLPPSGWGTLSVRLILHGRRVCISRNPRCPDCVLNDICPSAQLPVRPSARKAHQARKVSEAPKPRVAPATSGAAKPATSGAAKPAISRAAKPDGSADAPRVTGKSPSARQIRSRPAR